MLKRNKKDQKGSHTQSLPLQGLDQLRPVTRPKGRCKRQPHLPWRSAMTAAFGCKSNQSLWSQLFSRKMPFPLSTRKQLSWEADTCCMLLASCHAYRLGQCNLYSDQIPNGSCESSGFSFCVCLRQLSSRQQTRVPPVLPAGREQFRQPLKQARVFLLRPVCA